MAQENSPADTPERDEFYARIDPQHPTPLWTVMSGLITPEPKSPCLAHLWRYDEVRPALSVPYVLYASLASGRTVPDSSRRSPSSNSSHPGAMSARLLFYGSSVGEGIINRAADTLALPSP